MKFTLSGPSVDWMLESVASIAPSAFKVRLRAAATPTLMLAAFNVMWPASTPPLAPPVEIVTLPLANADAMVAELIDEPLALAVKFGSNPVLLATSLMVMSYGSSSQVPERPRGAAVSTLAGRASSQPPEVSMNPPSPPSTPPRTLRLPKARVDLSLHRITRPPSPAAVASATMLACGPKYTAWAFGTVGSLPCSPPPTST